MKLTRSSGVLMPISTLFGSDSIGCFGKEAREFVDFLAESGFTWWQVLPFSMADACNSPYKSYSAFGGNPYFVDIRTLAEEGYLTPEELALVHEDTHWVCEYKKLADTRIDLLRLAATRATDEDREAIAAFAAENPYIEQFCTFMGHRAANDDLPWYQWKTEKETGYAALVFETEHFAWQFIQYHFMKQWTALRAYANEHGILILGDIPIYVDYDSCDVWANRDQFRLDETGAPAVVAGCPPDYFAEDGQLWGNPIYDWDKMKDNDFSWWAARIRHMLTLFDGVRIDHVRGLEAYWSIPANAETAREGQWIEGPGEPFLACIRRVVEEVEAETGHGAYIIAEDLGETTPSLEAFVEGSGFPGMRVLQFAFDGDPKNSHLPYNYPKNTVAYTGTHDNNTLVGFIWETDTDTRRRMLDYCGYNSANWDSPAAPESVIRTLLSSTADLAILPIQDILGHGADTRINTPGRPDGNWCYRISKDQFASINRWKYRFLNETYGRRPLPVDP